MMKLLGLGPGVLGPAAAAAWGFLRHTPESVSDAPLALLNRTHTTEQKLSADEWPSEYGERFVDDIKGWKELHEMSADVGKASADAYGNVSAIAHATLPDNLAIKLLGEKAEKGWNSGFWTGEITANRDTVQKFKEALAAGAEVERDVPVVLGGLILGSRIKSGSSTGVIGTTITSHLALLAADFTVRVWNDYMKTVPAVTSYWQNYDTTSQCLARWLLVIRQNRRARAHPMKSFTMTLPACRIDMPPLHVMIQRFVDLHRWAPEFRIDGMPAIVQQGYASLRAACPTEEVWQAVLDVARLVVSKAATPQERLGNLSQALDSNEVLAAHLLPPAMQLVYLDQVVTGAVTNLAHADAATWATLDLAKLGMKGWRYFRRGAEPELFKDVEHSQAMRFISGLMAALSGVVQLLAQTTGLCGPVLRLVLSTGVWSTGLFLATGAGSSLGMGVLYVGYVYLQYTGAVNMQRWLAKELPTSFTPVEREYAEKRDIATRSLNDMPTGVSYSDILARTDLIAHCDAVQKSILLTRRQCEKLHQAAGLTLKDRAMSLTKTLLELPAEDCVYEPYSLASDAALSKTTQQLIRSAQRSEHAGEFRRDNLATNMTKLREHQQTVLRSFKNEGQTSRGEPSPQELAASVKLSVEMHALSVKCAYDAREMEAWEQQTEIAELLRTTAESLDGFSRSLQGSGDTEKAARVDATTAEIRDTLGTVKKLQPERSAAGMFSYLRNKVLGK
jgi:hypothetical protein